MILFGQLLSEAGLNFMSTTARHNRLGLVTAEVVCETDEDVHRVVEWWNEDRPLGDDLAGLHVRRGTPEEIAEYKEFGRFEF